MKCDICEREYKNRDSLRMHKDEKHGEPRFPCADCDRMFHSVNQRWYHSNKVHKIVKYKSKVQRKRSSRR